MAESDLRTWDAWRNIHQKFELSWWKAALAGGHSSDPGFAAQWKPVYDFIEPEGWIVDIGCGPRPPFAPCTVIEPLALEYKKITPPLWWTGVTAFAQPAEELIEGVRGDTIVCWNCLDHLIGWREVLRNMRSYGVKGARFAVATDFYEPFEGHPGVPAAEFMAEIDAHFNILKQLKGDETHSMGRMINLLMTAKDEAP